MDVRNLLPAKTHQGTNLDKIDDLEEDQREDLQFGDVVQQVDRFIFLVVDEKKVVLFNLVAHQEEYECEECADRHGDWKNQAHREDRESKWLIVADLEVPVVFVWPMSQPVHKSQESFDDEMRHI